MKQKILQNIANSIIKNLCELSVEDAHSVFVDIREQMQQKHEQRISVIEDNEYKNYLKSLNYEPIPAK
jgi:hypothetical protein